MLIYNVGYFPKEKINKHVHSAQEPLFFGLRTTNQTASEARAAVHGSSGLCADGYGDNTLIAGA